MMESDERLAPLSLKFLSGPLSDQMTVIERPVVTIGRDLANDIAIGEDRHLSRQHARLTWTEQGWRIENISRSNTVRIGDQEVQQALLTPGIIVSLGQETSFVALLDQDDQAVERQVAAVDEAPVATEIAIAPPAEPTHIARVTSSTDMTGIAATQIGSLDEGVVPTLEVTSNTQNGKQIYPLTGDIISIGRAATNDIVIDDPIVSGQHLQLVREGNEYTLIHPHPARSKTVNGLLYQGHKIRGDEQFKKSLSSGDLFRIGDEEGTLVTLRFRSGSDSIHATAPTIAPIRLTAETLTIGRRDDNTIVLAHPQVSARHAKLTREGATYRIDDLNSTNHVYVNGQIITGQTLKTGDEIRIGPYRLIFEGNLLRPYDESSFIRIDAVGLKKQGNSGVTLLDDISLSIPPRSFVALVGGSGAGKSTLLDALNGLRPAQNGTVYFNGADYYRNTAAYATQIGYVPQDDIVHADLTVERALYFAAKIRLPHDFTEEQIEQRITEVLDEVELTHRRSLMVKSLSGGQRKRVSIALELLANPSVFFLDEPTSGLDPGLDRKMMFLLRKLADRGHTILLVTHATNNINSCDYVCFLSAGGRLAYFGPPEQAKTYFGKTDFAEIYTALEPTDESPAVSADAQSRYRASSEYTRYVATPLHKEPEAANEAMTTTTPGSKSVLWRLGSGWRQFLVLSRRYIELLRNDSTNLAILLLQAPIIALMLVLMLRIEVGDGIFNPTSLAQCRTQIVTATGPLTLPQAQQAVSTSCQNALNFLTQAPAGIAYTQAHGGISHAMRDFLLPGAGTEAQTALFIMAFATILFGCINGAREFVKEAPIYRRERAVNLGIAPYMFSKFAVLGVLCLFQSFVLLAIVQLAEPLRQGVFTIPFLEAYITLALTSFAGLMTGLAISAVAPNNDRAISFVPIILLPQVIFSGAIIALKDWPTQILATLFPSRWAMAALGTVVGLPEGSGGDQLYGADFTYHGTLYTLYTKAEATQRLTTAWGVLAALIVALMALIWIFLKRKDARA
jgi:ABC-type multidrug transport system ATPase subunit/pSer/pThr/pTyr-binding forkhead associated (FHA) protein